MKILVINTKGGCGKSTLSSQILAPFLYDKVNSRKSKSLLCEMDAFNHDAKTFTKTEIIESKQVDPLSESPFEMQKVITDDRSCIVDSGGNASGEAVLEQYIRSHFINRFDLIFIPLTKGEQSIINAVKTYTTIRKFTKVKIIFALSGVTNRNLIDLTFIRFFGDKKNYLDGSKGHIEEITECDRNFIYVHDTSCLEYSRLFGKTIFELYENGGKGGVKYHEELDDNIKSGNSERINKANFSLIIYGYADKFYHDSIQPCFKEIERIYQQK
jgi:hypothetical protein